MPKDKANTKPTEASDENEALVAGSAPELPKDLARELEGSLDKPKSPPRKKAATKSAGLNSDTPATKKSPAESESPLIANTDTDRAVDDIMAGESDELLAVEDAVIEEARFEADPRRQGGRLKRFFKAWWHNPWARWGTALALLAVVAVIAAIPSTRYYTLNALGVRSSASLIVLDDTTQLPLKNVTVSLGGKRAYTNINGSVKFTDLKLGTYNLKVQRLAFATKESKVTVGWGSNPLGTYSLKAVGRQYTITLVDYLSGKPVLAAEVSDGDASALSDKNGKVVLTRDDTDMQDVEVRITASGYRSENLTLKVDSAEVPKVVLVPDRKAIFVSKQSGKYDLFAMDIDGRNKKLLLAGTGRETNSITLATNGTGTRTAMVSTRDDKHDHDGYPLSALTLVDTNTGAIQTLDYAEQIQLIDWIGNRLVYQTAASGASASNPQRYRIISYDFETNSRTQLATANQFNAVMSADGQVYYANSSTDPKAQLGFFKVKPNGTARQRLLDQEVWSAFRTSPAVFKLQTPDGWYDYSLKSLSMNKTNTPPNYKNRLYIANGSGDKNAWVDNRDGKGTLLVYENGSGKDNTIHAQDGLTYPVRWLNDHVLMYRVVTKQETADYAVSVDGGPAKKVADVSGTYGLSRAY